MQVFEQAQMVMEREEIPDAQVRQSFEYPLVSPGANFKVIASRWQVQHPNLRQWKLCP
jgi:hypothetical protein